MTSERRHDLIVVGGGAAGAETAARVAEAGRRVLLVTTSLDTIFAARRERPAAEAPDGTLQHRLRERLPVAPDGSVGSWELHGAAKGLLERIPTLSVLQSSVDALLVEGDAAVGVATWEGVPRRADRVALCVGSFLRARLRRGASEERAGRPGEMAYDELATDLERRGVPLVPVAWDGPEGVREDDPERYAQTFSVVDRAGADGHAVRAVRNLYLAGVCRIGPADYATAAQDGAALARKLLSGTER